MKNLFSFASLRLCVLFFFFASWGTLYGETKVKPGIDFLFTSKYHHLLKGKRVGVITNHTAVNQEMITTVELLKKYSKTVGFNLAALFAPEHGLTGSIHADQLVTSSSTQNSIPIFNLYGKTKRPTKEMLDKIDVLIFDIQDIGSRSYTYISTLFYSMEEAAKYGKQVVVLDRPNPINGITIDGPPMEEKWRSIVGYINVPYCHGMTVGELSLFFNSEYKVGCQLNVIPMEGWQRSMTFKDTGLPWIPTSPQIPESSTVWYYPTTGGILGELHLVSIGVGYTLPFKVVGAPWIDAEKFAAELNEQNFPGVQFQAFHYHPFFGKFSKQECHGVLIHITDFKTYRPLSTQYLILGVLKNLYPEKFQEALAQLLKNKEMFCKINGSDNIAQIMAKERHFIWKLKALDQNEQTRFLNVRKKYLIPSYESSIR